MTSVRTLDEEEVCLLDTLPEAPAPGDTLFVCEDGEKTGYYVIKTKQSIGEAGWDQIIYVKPLTEMMN